MQTLSQLVIRAKKFSRTELAATSGLSQPYISAIMTKQKTNPTLAAYTKLYKAVEKLEKRAASKALKKA